MTLTEALPARREKDNKTMRHREFLLKSVGSGIIPILMAQGFASAPRTAGVVVDQKHANAFPFGLLRRDQPNGTADLVEIQFKSHKRPAFRINVCAVPKDGMVTLGGMKTASQLDAGGLHDHIEMYDSPRSRRWFSLRFWRFRTPVQSDYDQLALRVATFLPEIDVALRQGMLGPHMRKMVFPAKS